MRISGLNKLTLLDYPNLVACIIFTQGCNFRCPFCQNSSLISNDEPLLEEADVLTYLEERKHILDGVVISGGEPTIQPDLKAFIRKVKVLGLKVKLDTNGFRYDVLKDLIDNNLLDYVAMDIKNSLDKYDPIAGTTKVNIDNIKKSIKLLQTSKVDHEFRTTIMKEYHQIEDLKKIIELIGDDRYFIQNFRDSDMVLDHTLHSFSNEELQMIANEFKDYKQVKVRGL